MSQGNTVRTVVSAVSVLALAFAGSVVFASPAVAAPLTAATEGELISAINTANANADLDVITLSGTITLNATLPGIIHNINFVGAAGSSIDAGGFTVFHDLGATANIDLSFTDINITDAYYGIETYFSNITVTGSTFDNAPVHIRGDGVTVIIDTSSSNNAADDDGFNLDLLKSPNVTITRSSADSNGDAGFDLEVDDSPHVMISNSSATGNDDSGFEVDGYNQSTIEITTSSALNNGDEGFDTTSFSGSEIAISSSTATGNVDDGFDAGTYGADSTTSYTLCTSTGNKSAGFDFVLKGGAITGSRLTATGNGDEGLDVRSDWDFNDGPLPAKPANVTISDSEISGTTGILADPGDPVVGVGIFLQLRYASTFTFDRVTTESSVNGGVMIDDAFGVDSDYLNDYAGGNSTVTFTDSTIANNLGPGVFETVYFVDLIFDRSTISGNSAGGLIAELESTSSLTINNSTVSGNTAELGGGILVTKFDEHARTLLTITHSTVTNNHATVGGPGGVGAAGPDYVIDHSIVADNTGTIEGSGALVPSDLATGFTTSGTVDYSLVQVPSSYAVGDVAAGTANIVGKSAKLGPLADNGGPTFTHLPLDGSPVINAGNATISGAPATDQRGLERIVGVIDMGAVEIQPFVAMTGADATAPLTGGAILLGVGAVLLFMRRRRTVHPGATIHSV